MKLALTLLKESYAVCKLAAGSALPALPKSEFFSLTNTPDEISIVCRQESVEEHWIDVSSDWRILKIAGPLEFTLVGIIARISAILKDREIPVFIISTFLTDYILVKNKHIKKAIESLQSNSYSVIFE